MCRSMTNLFPMPTLETRTEPLHMVLIMVMRLQQLLVLVIFGGKERVVLIRGSRLICKLHRGVQTHYRLLPRRNDGALTFTLPCWPHVHYAYRLVIHWPLILLPEAFRFASLLVDASLLEGVDGVGVEGVGVVELLASRRLSSIRLPVAVRLPTHRRPQELIREVTSMARVVRPVDRDPRSDITLASLPCSVLFLRCSRLRVLCLPRVALVVSRVVVVPPLVRAPSAVTRPLTVLRCLSWPTEAPSLAVVEEVVPVLP